MKCSEVMPRISFYVDGELSGAEALEFEAHLTECGSCREAYDQLRGTVDAVRGARPLYEPPEGSYSAVQAIAAGYEPRQRLRRWLPAAAAAAVLIAGVMMWSSAGRSRYEQFAAQAHREFVQGAFPLDVTSNEPQAVSTWLQPRVPFRLKLPNYPEGGRKRYALRGARLMQFGGRDVAYLAYHMDGKPISLMISSSMGVAPWGGESYRSGGLTFYFSSERGLRVIAWTDNGLTYALVSNLDVKGAESCVICHGAEGERRKFESLGTKM